MLRSKILLLVLILVTQAPVNSFAQDSSKIEWKEEFEINDWENSGNPFWEINAGTVNAELRSSAFNYAPSLLTDLKLGFNSIDTLYKNVLIEYKDNFTFVSNYSSKYNSFSKSNDPLDIKLDTWQLGFASRKAYGYSGKFLTLVPYYQAGIGWSVLKFHFPEVKTFLPLDAKASERFEKGVRFGMTNEAGVLLRFGNHIAFNTAYRFDVIFPRYLIWKHLGSIIIEYSTQEALNNFINKVSEASPLTTPIVNFVLKNALAYAFFSLKKEKSFWPFESESPFTFRTFKVGVTYYF